MRTVAEKLMLHWTFLLAVLLALVHLISGRLRFFDGLPRSRWLSFAGGTSISYVFLHLLPDLAEREEHLAAFMEVGGREIANPTFLVGLIGLTFFYGLERVFRSSGDAHPHAEDPQQDEAAGGEDREETPDVGVFWVHIASFGLYNAMAGYLLSHETMEPVQQLLYGVAIGLHFVVVDFGLREQHRETYHRIGRYVLAICIMGGWALGQEMVVRPWAVTLLMAFLAGGITLNVLKEELPEERQSRLWAFVAGVVFYATLLLATGG